MILIYILLYINTLLAQSNMFYPILILIPIAFKYNYQRYENRNVNRKEMRGLNENIMDLYEVIPRIFKIRGEENSNFSGGWLDGMAESLLKKSILN